MLPVQLLADMHHITLPKPHELPASYSMRMWLTRRLHTLEGRHKAAWQAIKHGDPEQRQGCSGELYRGSRGW